jgi:hypothetical protein
LFARDEVEEQRQPFAQSGEDRLPTLVRPRQIPIAGERADVAAICADYVAWLPTTTALKKLFVNADAGTILIGEQREFCRTVGQDGTTFDRQVLLRCRQDCRCGRSGGLPAIATTPPAGARLPARSTRIHGLGGSGETPAE